MLGGGFGFFGGVDAAALGGFEAAVVRGTKGRRRLHGRELLLNSHVSPPEGDSRSRRGFPYATFAHQHHQAVFTARDLFAPAREREVVMRVLDVRYRGRYRSGTGIPRSGNFGNITNSDWPKKHGVSL